MTWVYYALPFLVLAPVLDAAERLAPERPGEDRRWHGYDRRRRTDWLFAFLQLGVVPAVWLLLSKWAHLVAGPGPLHHAVGRMPWAAGAGAAFVLADLAAYWTHRLEHRLGATWRFHSVHHSPTRLNWLSGRRFHPLDVLLQSAIPVVLVTGLGFPLNDLGPYLFTAALVTTLAHCDLAQPGRAVALLVVTPAYHRTHHEQGREGTNFAVVLPALDTVFGTADFAFGERRFGVTALASDGFQDLLRLRHLQRTSTTSPTQNETALAT